MYTREQPERERLHSDQKARCCLWENTTGRAASEARRSRAASRASARTLLRAVRALVRMCGDEEAGASGGGR